MHKNTSQAKALCVRLPSHLNYRQERLKCGGSIGPFGNHFVLSLLKSLSVGGLCVGLPSHAQGPLSTTFCTIHIFKNTRKIIFFRYKMYL